MRITVYKAVTAGLFTGIGTLGGCMADGQLTLPEVIVSVGAALVAAAATWRVPYEVRG